MTGGKIAGGQPIISVLMKFYRGVKAIASFMDVHPDTGRKLLQEGKIPAKKDETGRLFLTP